MGMFRKYDIRGVFNDEITAETFLEIGLCVGTYLGGNGVVIVGRDARTSGPLLMNSLISGVMSTGCDVVNVGLVTTPTVYFGILHLSNARTGIIVTASHNPPMFNGLKGAIRGEGNYVEVFDPESIKQIYDEKQYKRTPFNTLGKETYVDLSALYIDYLKSRFSFKHKFKVVVDSGNGTTGFAVDLLRELGHEVIGLFMEPDGLFPNHLPNPAVEENLVPLKEKVRQTNADLGIAFDGDGDRVGLVDKLGNVVTSDQIIMIIADQILEKQKGEKIIVDVTVSRAIEDFVKKKGGVLEMSKVGYPFMQKKLRETGAPFAAEYSGHYYFLENGGYDDGVYAALKILSILDSTNVEISAKVREFPKFVSNPERRIRCSDERKFKIVDKIKSSLADQGFQIRDIDGVRIELEQGWGLVRASNTEPALCIRSEGETRQDLQEIKRLIKIEVDKALRSRS